MPTPTSPENKPAGKSFSVPDTSCDEESDMDIEIDYSTRSRSPAEASIQEVSPWSSPSPLYEPPVSPDRSSNSTPEPASELGSYSPSVPYDEDEDDEDVNDEADDSAVPPSDIATMTNYGNIFDPRQRIPPLPIEMPTPLYLGNTNVNLDYLPNLPAQVGPWTPSAVPQVDMSMAQLRPPTLHPHDLLVNIPPPDYFVRQQKMEISSLISPDNPSSANNRKRGFTEIDPDEEFVEIPNPGPLRKIVEARRLRSATKAAAAAEDSQKLKEFQQSANASSASTTFSSVVARQAEAISNAQPQHPVDNSEFSPEMEPSDEQIQGSESQDQLEQKNLSEASIAGKTQSTEQKRPSQLQSSESRASYESQRERGEPPLKRSRLRDLAIGIVIGGITTVAALATLPESLFN
jgi:hypothetical protein